MRDTMMSGGLPRLSQEAAKLLRLEVGEALKPRFEKLSTSLISDMKGKLEDALSELESAAGGLVERASSNEEIANRMLAAASDTRSALLEAQNKLEARAADLQRMTSSVSAANVRIGQALLGQLTKMGESAVSAQRSVDGRLAGLEVALSALPEAAAQLESRIVAQLDAAARTVVESLEAEASKTRGLIRAATIGFAISAGVQLVLLAWLVFGA